MMCEPWLHFFTIIFSNKSTTLSWVHILRECFSFCSMCHGKIWSRMSALMPLSTRNSMQWGVWSMFLSIWIHGALLQHQYDFQQFLLTVIQEFILPEKLIKHHIYIIKYLQFTQKITPKFFSKIIQHWFIGCPDGFWDVNCMTRCSSVCSAGCLRDTGTCKCTQQSCPQGFVCGLEVVYHFLFY